MVVSVLVVAAIVAGMVWYAGRTDWRVLFSGLDAKDTQQIGQELAAAGIPYQMTEDGSGIEVGAEQVDKARLEVATKGMPQSGRMGFELFDKPNWVGSEFDEKVNYQRALEGELEHTIGTLAVVRSARVHLVLPKDSLFGDEPQVAKASVVLQLRRSVMPPEQVEAIRSLVAGAVENLSTENVALVDADGRLNLAAPSQGAEGGDAERALADKLVTMLEPTAGAGNVRATVNVVYDEGSEEKTDEVYDPAQVVPLSMHKSEQTMGPRPRAAGVPGTASNTPAATTAGSVPAVAKPVAGAAVPPLLQTANGAAPNAALPVYPQNGSQGDGSTMTEETGSYAVTKHLSHTEQGPGRVRRVTAAVVVNDRMGTEGSGKSTHTVWTPRSVEEMQRLEQLARAAVGFDATRGDQVVIENVSFSSNVPEAAPTGMEKLSEETGAVLHAQPGLVKTLCFSALGLLLVMVLKPMTRQMMSALSQSAPLALAAGQTATGRAGRAAGAKSLAAPDLGGARLTDTQAIYDHISQQIRKEPVQSTRLLESWINQPVEEEE
jgi:flagellar M-ring protein FliF